MAEGPVLAAAAGSLCGKASLGAGAGYVGSVRGRGDQLQGAVVSGKVVPPALLLGLCMQQSASGGLLPAQAELRRINSSYSILFVPKMMP